MDFRILGVLEVSGEDGPIPLGGPKQRAVLAHLLLRANTIVPADTLIDEVWGEEPPPAARASLQSYVSHLRTALGDGRIAGVRPGYLLRADAGEIDAERARHLMDEGLAFAGTDPGRAHEAFERSLRCWRGAPFADLTDEPSLQPEIRRLEELRLSVSEDLTDVKLALGHHAEVAAELPAVIEQDPTRERPWGQLMVALYRSGRQAEALETYRRAHATLGEELGIDPGPELQELHRRILTQDAEIGAPGPLVRAYLTLQRRGLARLRWIVATVLVAVLTATGLTVLAAANSRRAAREDALGRARELASSAIEDAGTDPVAALRGALEAERIAREAGVSAPRVVVEALHRAVRASRVVLTLPDAVDVAFSADGARVALADPQGGVLVVDAASGAEGFRVDAPASAVAFSPDGALLAGAARSSTWLRRVDTGALVLEIPGRAGAIAFDPEGDRLVAAGDGVEPVVLAVSPAGSSEVRAIDLGLGRIFNVDDDSRGARSVVAADRGAAVVDLATGAVTPLAGHDGPVFDA
ncbi:MAG TPA: BTAD domain-containing putative transcriptional regulator, partial [Actinomycetota bacterium]|nr:BTAD domain-containing putative transcriptional regulator [Actinomycetota bacterium]